MLWLHVLAIKSIFSTCVSVNPCLHHCVYPKGRVHCKNKKLSKNVSLSCKNLSLPQRYVSLVSIRGDWRDFTYQSDDAEVFLQYSCVFQPETPETVPRFIKIIKGEKTFANDIFFYSVDGWAPKWSGVTNYYKVSVTLCGLSDAPRRHSDFRKGWFTTLLNAQRIPQAPPQTWHSFVSTGERARERESEGERPRTRIHLQLAHALRGVNIMAKIWFRLFKQCQMMKSQEQTRKASSVWGLSVFFTLEAPHKFQWGICIEVDWSRQAPIQVWPPWRERGRERERKKERERERTQSP